MPESLTPAALDQWPVKIEIAVSWGDQDAFGHVNNTRFLRYFEDVRIAYFEAAQVFSQLKREAIGPILKNTFCDFLRPLTYPDRVWACTRVQELRSRSMMMTYGLFSQTQKQWVAVGSGLIVFVDFPTMAKVNLPSNLREQIEQLERPGETR